MYISLFDYLFCFLSSLQVFIDARNTGEWASCVNISSLNLPANWLTKAHIGISASTGQLADNHDVLYLKTFSDAEVLDQKEEEDSKKVDFVVDSKLSTNEQIKQ
jgi:mannose-binding lectin 2